MPITASATPIPIMIKPLLAHSGLAYINDDVGPTTALLCNVKIIPAITKIIDAIIRHFPYFVSVNCIYNYCLNCIKNFMFVIDMIKFYTTKNSILK